MMSILAVFLLSAIGVSGQPNQAANNKETSASQNQPTVQPLHTQDVRAERHQDQSNPHDNPPAGNAPIEGAKVWWRDPNWWLVITAGATALVIGWQSFETRKAAVGAIASSKAASIQIKAMKDTERARLVLQPLRMNSLEIDFGWQEVEITAENIGPSHAMNVRFQTRCEITTNNDEPSTPPSDLRTAGIVRTQGQPAKVIIPISYDPDDFRPGMKNLVVHLWGTAAYEDIFTDPHIVRFHYTFKIWSLKEAENRDGVNVLPIVGITSWAECSHPKHNYQS